MNFIKDLDSGEMVPLDQYNIEGIKLKRSNQQWGTYWNKLIQSHNQLCDAAQSNDLHTLRKLLDPTFTMPIDIDMKLEDQWCALHFACCERNIDCVKLLLSHKANPNITNIYGSNALHIACLKGKKIVYIPKGDYEICQLLINNKTNVNIQDRDGNTPLHHACSDDYPDIVELLLDNGADWKILNNENLSPVDLIDSDETLEIFQHHGIENLNKSNSSKSRSSTKSLTKPPLLKNRVSIESKGPKDFKVLQMLGRGSFGQVYLVQQRDTNQYYAMKILNKFKVKAQSMTTYAHQEKRVLQYVKSPFIVKLRHAYQTDNKLYLIMDYCPGGDLEGLMKKRGKVPEHVTKNFAAEIILALEALHQKCIIYRDLKPSNILIAKDGHIKLTDFGLSKQLQTLDTITSSFCGSYAYLSPDILEKRGHGFPIDWYLLGLTLYELTFDSVPFYDKNKDKMFKKVREAPLERPKEPQISDTFWSMLQQLLVKDPSQRLGSLNDAEDLKKHPWFEGIDFKNVVQQKLLKVPKVEELQPETESLKITFSESSGVLNSENFYHNWEYNDDEFREYKE